MTKLTYDTVSVVQRNTKKFCPREVWYFVFLVLELENNQFGVLYASFLRVFKEKNSGITHLTKTTSKLFLMSWNYKTHLWKSRFRGDDFSSKFRYRRAVGDEFLAYVTSHGLLKIRTMTKQTNSCLSSFSFSDLKLSIFCVTSHLFRLLFQMTFSLPKKPLCSLLTLYLPDDIVRINKGKELVWESDSVRRKRRQFTQMNLAL